MVTWRDSAPSPSLVDVLDRVLDKGLVVAGDIRVTLADVELLTIKIRLLVCSVDKAQEIGLDWWKHDGFLSSSGREEETKALNQRIELLEEQLRLVNESNAKSGTKQQAPASRQRRSRRQ